MEAENLDEKSPLRVVQPLSRGPMLRLLGSLDVDGEGTKFEIEDVDPFIMCDHVSINVNLSEPPMRPPFCAHPHAGNAVASILVEGEDMFAWDNVNGMFGEKLRAGGVYVVCTGQGCVHDEGADPFVLERIIRRTQFGNPGDERGGEKFRFFQLWFDPGHVHAEEGAPLAWATLFQPTSVPMISCGSMKTRVLLGSYEGEVGVQVPVTVLHCSLIPFLGPGVLKIPAGNAGFIFSIDRVVKVAMGSYCYTIPPQQELLLPPQAEAYDLSFDVECEVSDPRADVAMQILVCFGVPSGKPYYKLIGYGGALVASSEERVRSLMVQYEKDPKNFGVPQGCAAADMGKYGLQIGYKNPMDGKGECQRSDCNAEAPEARFYMLENGPYQPKGAGKGSASK